FGSGEQADEVGPPGLAAGAPELYHLPVRQHDLEREHVGRGDAVLEAMGTTRVFRDVAADGAGALARWIGSVQQAMRGGRHRELDVEDAPLDRGDARPRTDVQDAAE